MSVVIGAMFALALLFSPTTAWSCVRGGSGSSAAKLADALVGPEGRAS